jgi:uncharacterized protein (DUF2062 family)
MNLVSPGEYSRRLQARLRRAFMQEHPPHQTAMSLSLGLFLMALPNLGVSVLLLGGIGYRYEWINRLALLASVMVLNPLAKGTVYILIFGIGTVILGPVPGVSPSDVSLSAGTDVLTRLLVGNLLFAAGLAVVGYGMALYGIHTARGRRS